MSVKKGLQLTCAKTGDIVTRDLLLADHFFARLIGLQGRRAMAPGQGLLLVPCYGGIHTFMMRFALDLVMLDKGGNVLRVVKKVKPWRVTGTPRGTHAVLEMTAGQVTLEAGERLFLKGPEGASGDVPASLDFLRA